ncbi:unnamed protein product [Lampetra fluviatilis]
MDIVTGLLLYPGRDRLCRRVTDFPVRSVTAFIRNPLPAAACSSYICSCRIVTLLLRHSQLAVTPPHSDIQLQAIRSQLGRVEWISDERRHGANREIRDAAPEAVPAWVQKQTCERERAEIVKRESTESAMTSQRIAVLFIAAILSVSLTPAIAKVGAVALAPVAIGAAGFGAGGIAAGGIAAKLMALAAAANGGGVAAGGIVAGLQAAGAAGLGPAAMAALGIAGSAIANVMADVSNLCRKKEEEGSKRAGGGR